MKIMNIFVIITISFLVITLAGILNLGGKKSRIDRLQNCIPPSVSWYFPENQEMTALKSQPILKPSEGWDFISSFPSGTSFSDSISIDKSNNDVWFIGYTENVIKIVILRFGIEKKAWEVFEFNNNEYFELPNSLFITDNDEVWTIGEIEKGILYLKKFDRSRNEFISQNIGEFPFSMELFHNPPIFVNESRTLWVSVNDNTGDSLVSINLDTKQYSKITLSTRNIEIVGITADKKNGIWVLINEINTHESKLLQIDTYSKKITEIPVAKLDDSGRFLYIDNDNNLWIGVNKWLDFSKEPFNQNEVILPSAFISDKFLLDEKYGFDLPYSMFQSTNGDYWFVNSFEIVNLNPIDAKWCIVTKAEGNLGGFEDKFHRVWLVVQNELFIKQQ
jgi:hypothetical protein